MGNLHTAVVGDTYQAGAKKKSLRGYLQLTLCLCYNQLLKVLYKNAI